MKQPWAFGRGKTRNLLRKVWQESSVVKDEKASPKRRLFWEKEVELTGHEDGVDYVDDAV